MRFSLVKSYMVVNFGIVESKVMGSGFLFGQARHINCKFIITL